MFGVIFSLAMAAFDLLYAISRAEKSIVILHAALAGFFLALACWKLSDTLEGVAT